MSEKAIEELVEATKDMLGGDYYMNEEIVEDGVSEDDWAAVMGEQPDDLLDAPVKADTINIDDVEVTLSAEIGRKRMKVKDIKNLTNGSIVSLEELSGEPMKIYANRKLVALGEVVIVNEHFGIRITEIV